MKRCATKLPINQKKKNEKTKERKKTTFSKKYIFVTLNSKHTPINSVEITGNWFWIGDNKHDDDLMLNQRPALIVRIRVENALDHSD